MKKRFFRGLFNMLSPGGTGARLSILIYHRVLQHPDPLFPNEVDTTAFDQQIALLATCFNVLPLQEALHSLRAGKLPPRAACITFDDGYADNAEIALPILRKHAVTATFFVATGFLDGGRMWNDSVIELVRRASGELLDLREPGFGVYPIRSAENRRKTISVLLDRLKYLPLQERLQKVEELCARTATTLPSDLMMRSEQVRLLHGAGMEIGGHTVNHPILASLDAPAARTEIAEGKESLEGIIRAPVRLFAYPNGKPNRDYFLEHARIVKNLGFDGAVSTMWGAARSCTDMYQLPRFTPWDRDQSRFLLRLAGNMIRSAPTTSTVA